MAKNISLYEKYLYPIWLSQEFTEEIQTADGKEIKILSPGEQNENSGPDFKNAKIVINNIVFVGDVEIDVDYSGWKAHGHNIDKNYNHVILHLSLNNPSRLSHVYSESGRKIPSVNLKKYIAKDFVEAIQNQELTTEDESKYNLKCEGRTDEVDYFIRERFIAELGYEKYEKKVERLKTRLLELKFLSENHISEPKITYQLPPEYYSENLTKKELKSNNLWEQLFYEFLSEALGYTKNRDIMLKLAVTANLDFFRRSSTERGSLDKIQTLLFKVSGLFTDFVETDLNDSNKYQKSLLRNWEEIKGLYDSDYLEETDWQFYKMRPQNFPTIRIAALSKYANQIINENMIKKLFEIINSEKSFSDIISKLQSLIIMKSFGFWENHFTFFKPAKTPIKYFVGLNRADEIIVNVIFPFFSLYADIFDLEHAKKKILKLINLYKQRTDYILVTDVAKTLGLENLANRTLFSQGFLMLYRDYCSKVKCKQCKIGKEIFN